MPTSTTTQHYYIHRTILLSLFQRYCFYTLCESHDKCKSAYLVIKIKRFVLLSSFRSECKQGSDRRTNSQVNSTSALLAKLANLLNNPITAWSSQTNKGKIILMWPNMYRIMVAHWYAICFRI